MDSKKYGRRLLEGVVRCTVFETLVYLLLACLALVERRCAGRMMHNRFPTPHAMLKNSNTDTIV